MTGRMTIVEVASRLGIGGVESHVMRLSEGLFARGHRVILLVEDEAVYGEETREMGAAVVVVPFDRSGRERAIAALSEETVDIIHAHNYRAARFAGPLAPTIGAAYLMTVHGPRPWWQRALFRAWSDPVLTVSEADRENITGPFGVRRDSVVVGFLGVDVTRFRPGIDADDLRREWGVAPGARLIVNVSRFSHRKARPALSLVETLPLVRDRISDASLVLVGGGPELERIRREAEKSHGDGSGRPARAVGPRTDIPRVLNAADLAVATATVALESLACGTPTIAYGRTGYFGPVTPENFEEGRALCFADHGRELPSRVEPRRLADDIISLLADREGARRRAEVIRALIAERYSVERMVEHVESLYERLLVGRGVERY
jgi:glycosyltransferase involved in cell wall biosynthesis